MTRNICLPGNLVSETQLGLWKQLLIDIIGNNNSVYLVRDSCLCDRRPPKFGNGAALERGMEHDTRATR